jgi:hypothetical protein
MVTLPVSLQVPLSGGGDWQEVVSSDSYILDPDFMIASAPQVIEWKLALSQPDSEVPADFLAGEKEIELNRSRPLLYARTPVDLTVSVTIHWEIVQPPPLDPHNDLDLIQGGSAEERYHLTASEHANLTNGTPSFDGLAIAQYVSVAKSGANFTDIQDAIDSITDATVSKQYCVELYPGSYDGPIVGKPYVHLRGVADGTGLVQIVGTTTPFTAAMAEDAFVTVSGIQFVCTPTTDDQSCVDVSGSIGFNNVFFGFFNNSDDITADIVKVAPSASGAVAFQQCSISSDLLKPGRTKDITLISNTGDGQLFLTRTSARVNINQDSGNFDTFALLGTGEMFSDATGITVVNQSTSSAAWVCHGAHVTKASAKVRVFASSDWRYASNGGGRFVGSYLNSSGNSAEIQFTGMVCSISGFTAGQEFMTETAAGDSQSVWLQSTNRDMGKTGNGLAIVTPYDDAKSGFVAWGPGTTYWTYDVSTREFVVTRSMAGVVRGSPVIGAAGQSVTLPSDYATHFVYFDSDGILRATLTSNEALYNNSIVVFEVYSDGAVYVVAKENHPLKFTSAISHAWHRLFGVLLEGTGAVATILSGAGRTIRIIGADVMTDHGLDTTIPDSAGEAVPWNVVYTGASGTNLTTAANALPGQFNNGTTLANTSSWVVYRLAVTKDNLNSATPQYLARAHTATFANQAAARTAANANNVAIFPEEIRKLEIAQLGFAIIDGDNTGAGTLAEIVVSRQTFQANFLSVAAATSAALVNVNTTAFDGMLGATDTSVQLALDTVDDWVKAGTMKIPSATTTVRNGITHANGLILLDTDDGKVYVSVASSWVALN